MKTGYLDSPLHWGKAPRWLFTRMVRLSTVIVEAILTEFSREVLLERLSDPVWFQSLGNVLGFDWHSSGLSTVTAGAVKEAINKVSKNAKIFAAGGKGKAALKTPQRIKEFADRFSFEPDILIKASKISAKVDSACIQDGYSIYHHTIFFTDDGKWTVVQQGIREEIRRARRYHWFSEKIKDMTEEPHTGIEGKREKRVLNLTAKASKKNKEGILELIKEKPEIVERNIKKIIMPEHHFIKLSDMNIKNIKKISEKAYEKQIKNFEELLEIKGTGPKALRALSLTSSVIYGEKPSFEDPVIFSYAHGGKDGTPYPVNRKLYDETIEIIEKAIKKAKIGDREKIETLRKLNKIF